MNDRLRDTEPRARRSRVSRKARRGLLIVDMIARVVRLEPSGTHHTGRCPFHRGRTRSLTVDAQAGRWGCRLCGAGGDAREFSRRMRRITRRTNGNKAER